MSGDPLSKRERLAIGRQGIPARDPHVRSQTFDEVNLGFTEHLAMLEAKRCLDGKRIAGTIDSFLHGTSVELNASCIRQQDEMVPRKGGPRSWP